MIYLFWGSDTAKVRAKAFEWVAKARAKEPQLSYVRLSGAEITDAALAEAAAAGALFLKRLLVVIDDPFAEPGSGEIFETHLAELVESDNAIVLLAPDLTAAKAKQIGAKAKMEYRFDVSAREEKRGFNTALVNALAARSRDKLWLELNRALALGDAPEMLHGLLHWKARDIMEKGSRAWRPEEARALSLRLITLLQDSRRGGLDLPLALERFALSL